MGKGIEINIENEKVVIVTGASRGIGSNIALFFGKQGANVVVNYIHNGTAVQKVVDCINNNVGYAFSYQADVSKPNQVKRMMSDIGAKFGHLDILINNASLENNKHIWEIENEQWLNSLTTTLYIAYLTSKYVLPYMLPNNAGKIVNVLSIHYSVPLKAVSSYCSAKAGLLMLTEVLFLELASYNIQVNAVSPELTLTDRTESILDSDGNVDKSNPVVAATPTKRPATVEEITQAVQYLCGPNSNYTSGTTIYIDGAYRHSLCPERSEYNAMDFMDNLMEDL
jgi:NAD(P)-dependent dehydrogenase (short-subunit alcohol dehydrogenase family)